MYIEKVNIKNIRSIRDFEMVFSEPAGWHVLIGDNGSGKSSVVRSIAATLIGPEQITAVLPVWEDWLSKGQEDGEIHLELLPDWEVDSIGRGQPPKNKLIVNRFTLKKTENGKVKLSTNIYQKTLSPRNYNWGDNSGWFSVAYGPFRRFTGGDERKNKVFHASPKAGAHLSVFGEDVALSEALDWLKELDNKRLREKEEYLKESGNFTIEEPQQTYISANALILDKLKRFINESGLLPHNAQFSDFDVNGNVIFVDGRGNLIPIVEMSDGYRSVLSMILELIRQLIATYGASKVFNSDFEEGKISLSGVVLIDEIDAHLHPTWQTRIGEWFTKYFPNIQFIVTTHSPLICRACENGSIWRLTAPGSDENHGEITGIEKDKLISGNILDAYGTELFGQSPVRSVKSDEMLEKLGKLNIEYALGKITEEEDKERRKLQKILSTDDPIGF
ncbi:MAG: AAA family ATPase [Chitinophagales bacterium]